MTVILVRKTFIPLIVYALKVTVGQKAKISCLVMYIFYSFNVKVYLRASKKVGFQLPKNKGEITTLYKTLAVK